MSQTSIFISWQQWYNIGSNDWCNILRNFAIVNWFITDNKSLQSSILISWLERSHIIVTNSQFHFRTNFDDEFDLLLISNISGRKSNRPFDCLLQTLFALPICLMLTLLYHCKPGYKLPFQIYVFLFLQISRNLLFPILIYRFILETEAFRLSPKDVRDAKR